MAAVATATLTATACAPLDCLPADVVAAALAFLAFADAARLSAASEFWSRSVSGHAATVCISRTAPPYLPRLRRYLKIRELQFSTPHRLPDAAGSLHGIHSHVNSHMEGLTELLAARPGIESLTLSDGLGAGLYGAQALARHFPTFLSQFTQGYLDCGLTEFLQGRTFLRGLRCGFAPVAFIR